MKFRKFSYGKCSGILASEKLEIDFSEDERNFKYDSIDFSMPDNSAVYLYDEDLDLFLNQCAEFKKHRDKRKLSACKKECGE